MEEEKDGDSLVVRTEENRHCPGDPMKSSWFGMRRKIVKKEEEEEEGNGDSLAGKMKRNREVVLAVLAVQQSPNDCWAKARKWYSHCG